jgi:CRISPR system Cascade subunit CasE
MHFSRVRISTNHLDQFAKSFQYNHYQLHQLLWKLFKDKPDDKREFLFRQDLDRQGLPVFYLLSKTQPKNFDDTLIIESKPFEPKLQAGDKLAFSLRDNPVAQLKEERSEEEKLRQEEHRKISQLSEKITKKRVRHDVVMHLKKSLTEEERQSYSQAELEQMAGEKWLQELAAKKGFRVLGVTVQGYQQHHFKKRQIKISSLDFDGVLEVTDPQLFIDEALFSGIGRAKAFGCGLLMIRRV